MSPALRHGVLLLLVVLAGAVLRVAELDVRPMHADEANQAVKVGHMLAGETYRFDPAEHHGPTLYYFGAWTARLRGEDNLAELTEVTLRLVPAFFGTLAIILLARVLTPLGSWPALAGAAFLALSPAAIYYSRYFIQETLLVTFTLGAIASGQSWWRSGGLAWAAGMGICAGLMQATKATGLLFAFAMLAAVLVVDRARLRTLGFRPWILAGVLAVTTAGLFYTSFGAHPTGLRDAFGTLAPMLGKAAGGESGHEKPWWYYGGLFIFRREGGYVWDQTLFLLLALAGGVLAFRSPRRLPRVLALATAVSAVILSFAPYKTPWVVVNLVPGLCALAAFALARMRLLAALPVALVVLGLLAWQVRQAVFLRPADPRNPYAYVHSSPDVRKFAALAAAAPPGPIKVISPEYWPLPWYLRARAEVGYWATPPEDCDASLVIVSADLAEEARSRLRGNYSTVFLGLRPGFVLVVFTPQE